MTEQKSVVKASKTLPPNYEASGTLDYSGNRLLLFVANASSLVLMALFGWLAWRFLVLLHPEASIGSALWVVASGTTGLAARAIVVVVTLVFILAVGSLHEVVHGAFFWLFTRERPVFGIKAMYFYAGAPDWYLPRNHYIMVGLAPFLIITLVGLVLAPIVSGTAAVWVLLAVVANAGGVAGDLLWVIWLLRQPPVSLVRDEGDAVTTYRPA